MTSTPLSPKSSSQKVHNYSITSSESSLSNIVVTLAPTARKSARKMVKDPKAVTAARQEANILSRGMEF